MISESKFHREENNTSEWQEAKLIDIAPFILKNFFLSSTKKRERLPVIITPVAHPDNIERCTK